MTRFMNIPEEHGENCIDTIYNIMEHELNIPTDNIQFQAVQRVGKPRQPGKETTPRPIIARFVLREDRDCVLNKKKQVESLQKI